jgi:hypothetical protein
MQEGGRVTIAEFARQLTAQDETFVGSACFPTNKLEFGGVVFGLRKTNTEVANKAPRIRDIK